MAMRKMSLDCLLKIVMENTTWTFLLERCETYPLKMYRKYSWTISERTWWKVSQDCPLRRWWNILWTVSLKCCN